MTIRLKSSQVQQGFGEALDRAFAGEDIIVERYNAPRIVMIGFDRYQKLVEAEQELLRYRLQQASAAASARATHLSESEVEALIERARSEVNNQENHLA
jgi:PHD/YefM family antitoxin component YafN of YafNO toxin-antitoxin module